MRTTIEMRINEFKKFHALLMSNAPKGFVPYYFPVFKNGKAPDHKAIKSRADISCKNAYSWKSKHAILSFDECVERIHNDGNIGLAGVDGLPTIIDIDTAKYYHLLPDGLITKSRKRISGHGFYWPDSKDKVLPCNIPTDFGEVRSCWQFVLIPGSYVPSPESKDKLAGYYTVERAHVPTTIKFDNLPFFFKDQYTKADKATKKAEENKAKIKSAPVNYSGNKSALFKLQIGDVVSTVPGTREGHPLHESDTMQNFSVSDGVAHCWRDEVSLNALQFLAVKSGYATCKDAGTAHKKSGAGPSSIVGDDGALFHGWLEAKKCNLIPKNDKIPSSALNFIVKKFKLCDEKLIPKRNEDGMLPKYAYRQALKIVEARY